MKKVDVLNFIIDHKLKSPEKTIRYSELSLKAGPANSEKLITMLTELISEGVIIETDNGGLRIKE